MLLPFLMKFENFTNWSHCRLTASLSTGYHFSSSWAATYALLPALTLLTEELTLCLNPLRVSSHTTFSEVFRWTWLCEMANLHPYSSCWMSFQAHLTSTLLVPMSISHVSNIRFEWSKNGQDSFVVLFHLLPSQKWQQRTSFSMRWKYWSIFLQKVECQINTAPKWSFLANLYTINITVCHSDHTARSTKKMYLETAWLPAHKVPCLSDPVGTYRVGINFSPSFLAKSSHTVHGLFFLWQMALSIMLTC